MGETTVYPPVDLTTAAIEAVNLILSQFGVSPLQLLLGLFSSRAKNQDTNNVIWAYHMSAYWPLQELGTQLAMFLKNGAPISDSRPEIQAQFGALKRGTIESIQGFAGVQTGPGGPGYWWLFWLIERSWAASGSGQQAVLQYVKAIDAITQVLAQQAAQPPPPPPPPTPTPPPTPAPPPTGGTPCESSNPDADEILDFCHATQSSLAAILAAIQGMSGGSGDNSACCAAIVGGLGKIVSALTGISIAIGNAGGNPTPIDLTPIVQQLADIAGAIAGDTPALKAIADAIANKTFTVDSADLKRIADAVQIFTQDLPALQQVDQWLVQQGIIPQQVADTIPFSQSWLDLIYLVVRIIVALLPVFRIAGVGWLLLTKSGQDNFRWFFNNFVSGLVKAIPDVLAPLSGDLSAIGQSLGSLVNTNASGIITPLLGFISDWTTNALTNVRAGLEGTAPSTTANVLTTAGLAMQNAAQFGIGSAIVTGLFELLLPEKLNTLNSLGPILAKFAGFDEVAAALQRPLYENAFGKSASYYYRGKFKPDYPDETDAVLWHARGLLLDPDLREVFDNSGMKAKYETAYVTSAYRGISPFVMIRLLESGVFTDAQTRDELTFAGLRPRSQDNMIAAGAYLAADPYRKQVVAAAEAQFIAGLLDETGLRTLVDSTRNTNNIDDLIVMRAQLQKHTTLAKEFETAYLDLAVGGLIDEPTYQGDLDLLGLQPDSVNARMAVLDARLKATERKQMLAAERALERQTLSIERKTALANFKAGNIDYAALAAALLATGLTPVQVAAWTDFAVMQQKGTPRFIYGLQKTPQDAQIMRERVTALMDQRKKLFLTDAQFLAELQALGIPADWQNALLAIAAAQTTPKSQAELIQVQT